MFHVDSGAGQSLCCCPDAFVSLQACAIEVIGVSGSLPIRGVGTAAFAVYDTAGAVATILIHNCLLSQTGLFNLLSVSQLQASQLHFVDFSLLTPRLCLTSSSGDFDVPLLLSDGLYSLTVEPLSIADPRYSLNPRFELTAPGAYVPPTIVPRSGTPPGLVDWACRLFVAPSRQRRVLAFPATDGPSFGDHLNEFCQQFIGPLSPPPSRRAYDPLNDLHMSDLSVRFMGTSHDKLKRTIELNRGLAPATGRVPTLNFPQGRFRQGKIS